MRGQAVESGTIEEWWKSPSQWRRTYTLKKQTWTEWSVDRAHQLQTPGIFPPRVWAELRIATPLIAPLFQAKNFLPEYPMKMEATPDNTDMSCISVVNPVHYGNQIDPDFLFPKYCLDKLGVLRGVITSNTLVTFNNFTVVDNRAIAKLVDVFVDGQKVSESKVSVLEPLSAADEALLQPSHDAVSEPFSPAASDPRPVLVHSERPIIPANMVIEGGGGPIRVSIVIGKDGKVKPSGPVLGTAAASLGVVRAAEEAAKGFRYQPYLVEGQPVEVAWAITFPFGAHGYEAPPMNESDKPTGFDPKRDPAADLKDAEAEAQQTHKRILLDVGGDWCIWCGYLDRFFADHPDVNGALKANYVLVKVNWSAENHNSDFFARYAFVGEFPFFLVLDENGKLLKAQKTGELEKGNSYDPDKMKAFLNQWKAGATGTSVAVSPGHP